MGRSWGFIKCRWVTIRCPVNLFCPTQCGGSVSLFMGRMMTQLMPSRGRTCPKTNSQDSTDAIKVCGLTWHWQPNKIWSWRNYGHSLWPWHVNDKWVLFSETNNCMLWHLCSSHHQRSKSTSISLPPHCWLAKLHFILWTAQMPSNCQFVGCPMPGIYSFSAQISAYFILFCFVFSKLAHNQAFSG